MQTTNSPTNSTTASPPTRLAGYSGPLRGRALRLLVAAAFCAAQALPVVSHAANPSEQAVSVASVVSVLSVFSVVKASQKGAEAVDTVIRNGSQFVVKAVEASADGVVYVLEGVSDGTRVSLKGASHGEVLASLAVGTVVAFSTTEAGLAVSVAGVVVALILNEAGKKLLYSKQITP